MNKIIYITEFDAKRLNQLLMGSQKTSPMDEKHLKDLKEELQRAKIVNSKDIPRDIITMNSIVEIKDLDSNEELTYNLVFPQDAEILQNKISILAPIGTALIGYKAGDIIEWQVPAGTRRLKIVKILYQPEASGHYHL